MKKSIITTLAVGIGLAGGTGVSVNTAQAASWHKGMPKALQGTWKTKYNKAFRVSFKLKNGKNYTHSYGNDPDFLNRTHYRYLGHHDYKIVGYEPIYSKKNQTRYFKWVSKHHIVFSTYLKKGYGTSYYR
ncbi:hypothetical protein HC026_09335 [Lactobacillus sp. LC28-10]|uniref:Uncharacterized protein n=1 Tax=Secundilactobacillus angelensis TaxID=2722706 RepID=A0ABX1L1M4_9LACO|nr:hypothetical protein [Secundilactobacillus angelensis]MCH5462621.1 hypothetical protein [Secundilactobacillus angelensis]NLR19113.1 hypothetical protein [Secundilactobacillus angelensis]